MTDVPRTWSIVEVVRLMDEQKLLADMFPSYNEYDKTWDICLSDAKGNGIEYISFATEDEGERFCEALEDAIARKNGAEDRDGP